MDNPWQQLPKTAPYVLERDRVAIEAFNANSPSIAEIRYELLPEPFLGNVEAPVVLLALNPGYSAEDAAFYAKNEQTCRSNLLHAVKDYPFYPLNPKFSEYSGPRWWQGKLRWFVKDSSLEKVASNLCCIEFFPYHSKRFGAGSLSVESQQYSFYLVKQAIKRNALIVVMRGASDWFSKVSELKEYATRCDLRNVQRSWLSPGNFDEGWYEQIVGRIKGS